MLITFVYYYYYHVNDGRHAKRHQGNSNNTPYAPINRPSLVWLQHPLATGSVYPSHDKGYQILETYQPNSWSNNPDWGLLA